MTLTTFTNAVSPPVQDYDLSAAAAVLASGGLVLLPTDTWWCVAADVGHPAAVQRLRRLCSATDEYPLEMLCSGLPMLKAYTYHLHPRLETLLDLHRRPLTVVVEEPRYVPAAALRTDGSLAARLTQDGLCRHLVSSLGRPLITGLACHHPLDPPNSFGRIRSDFLQGVDYVLRYRQRDVMPPQASVMVRLNELDELEFLRE